MLGRRASMWVAALCGLFLLLPILYVLNGAAFAAWQTAFHTEPWVVEYWASWFYTCFWALMVLLLMELFLAIRWVRSFRQGRGEENG